MRLRMEKDDLLSGLQIVKNALSSHNVNPILDGILLEAENGELRILASDSTLQIDSSIPAEVLAPGGIVLPGQLFTRIASNLPQEPVEIALREDGAGVALTCGSFQMNLQGMDAEEYPQMTPSENGVVVKMPQGALKEMIAGTVFSVAKDQTRPILTGVLFNLEAGSLRLVGLSANRMAIRQEAVAGNDAATAVIAESSLRKIMSVLSDDETKTVRIHFGRANAFFDMGKTRLHTMFLAGDFLKYENIMPKEQSTNVIVEREALLKALLRASSLSQESDKKLVRMKIESDTIHLSANSEIGHVNDEVAAQNNGQTLEIAFNATFLTDILSRVGEESLLMQFKNSEVAGVFRPIHGDGFYYLVAPVKI